MMVSLVNEKGGVGKSTIAVHLAAFLHRDKSVCFVDTDPQQSGSRWLMNGFDDDLTVVQLCTSDEILDQIPSLKGEFEFIICDAPGALREETRSILTYTDLALIPITPSMLDVDSTIHAIKGLNQVRSFRNGDPDALIIPNRIQGNTNISKDLFELLETIPIPRTRNYIRQLTRYADAPSQKTISIDADMEHLFLEVLEHAHQAA